MNDRLPDALVIGDSHATALKAGCDANALRSEMLVISGNFWHGSVIMHHPEHGLWAKTAAQQKLILGLKEKLGGGSVLRPDIPVIASIGFHLGRLAPPLSFQGHVTEAEGFAHDPDSLFASSGFVSAYVGYYRGYLLRLLQKMAARAPLIVVAPPDVVDHSTFRSARTAIVDMVRDAGVRVFDPCEHAPFSAMRPLPPDYRSADNVHGNDRYGSEVIAAMLAEGAAQLEATG